MPGETPPAYRDATPAVATVVRPGTLDDLRRDVQRAVAATASDAVLIVCGLSAPLMLYIAHFRP
jgi:hypothetical protein